jgi:FtsX-like permease family
MHGLFFGSPLSTAAEDEYFLSARCRNQPYLQPFVHLLPIFAQQLALELPQDVLRRAQDVASCARPPQTPRPLSSSINCSPTSHFRGQDAIGKHIQLGGPKIGDKPLEIIGVVQNAKRDSLDQDFLSTAYVPLAQIHDLREDTTFEIRTATTPGALIPAVRNAMAGVNKSASLEFSALKQQAVDSVLQERLVAILSGFFGGLALLLTALGLYGVMVYVVTLRTHEIGSRMALGAQQSSISRLVLHDALIVLAAEIAAGLLGSIWISPLMKGLLFGLKPNDPSTLALAIICSRRRHRRNLHPRGARDESGSHGCFAVRVGAPVMSCLTRLFRKSKLERQLDSELCFHV